ncbi:CapA family protein [Ramlibacter sp. AW1]|uniref:CapA family protein n=1 Tax=Ramlibacter aurantiacus TaxID=2801330 RepID=A0A936ZS47_9BURK|nr:CapA family protein [Ramlibacter aurantiacus]MBL0422656.1 CapA family protein [Ramlibacter aurantiacus]
MSGSELYQAQQGRITMALVGDTMLSRALRPYQERDYLALAELLRSADVSFANLESTVREPEEGVPNFTQGTPMTTPPALLQDLKWMGIDVVSVANNHFTDYGVAGVLASLRHLERAGIPFSGAGRTLMEARRPAYVDTPAGRVAVVSATSFYRPWNRAADSRPDSAGRPGINPLGFSTSHTVDDAALAALKRISDELGLTQERTRHRTMFYSASEAPADDPDSLMLLGTRFRKGERFGTRTRVDAKDAEANLRWIREARKQADWVVFSFHNHEFGEAGRRTAPTEVELEETAEFVAQFARAAIDAGAHVVAGHGPHLTMGAEIYKGCPIFYSLGNFVFQNETIDAFPAEAYGRFGLDAHATPSEFLDARTGNDSRGFPASPEFWESCVAVCEFDAGALSQVRLHPLDLGHGRPRAQRGRPVLARGEQARRILARIDRLSRRLGTELQFEGDTAVLRLAP